MSGASFAGRQIETYRVDTLLGSGGVGDVYRAFDTKLNRAVALKVLADDLVDPDARRRFQREAQTASSLNHPHILTVFDVGEFEGHQYFVTELVDGGTLREWAGAERRTWRQIVELLAGVADGLAAAHRAGVLHRDIKPENILVAKNGYAKLADFGLAKLAETGPPDLEGTLTREVTRPGLIMGTVAYMSPEQASGRPLDARADIFSFGIVLYELLAGRRPFAGATDLEVLQQIMHGAAPPLGELSSDLPVGLRISVEKTLENEPADRYQTMQDVVVDLRRAARTTSETARPVTVTGARRRRWWSVALPVSLVILTVVGVWSMRTRESGWRNPLEGARFTRVTDFEGVEIDPVLSRDGNFLAFISDRDGPPDVWVMQLGSGQFLNLTKGKVPFNRSQIRVLGFTPDGSYVTLMTPPPTTGPSGTLVIPTIGGAPRPFVDGAVDPQWSRDGTRLLFFSIVQDKDVMYVADADGGNRRQVFPPGPGEHNHFMGWSPDGRYVYSARATRNVQESDIWRAVSTGGPPEQLTHHNGWVAYPTQIDDRTLLYIATDENNSGSWLYAMDLERHEEHRLSVGIEQYSSIAASSPTSGKPRRLVASVSNPVGSLWSIPIGNSVATESDASVFHVPSAGVWSPRFGPDYLLYLSSRELTDSLWKLRGEAATELWKAGDGAVLAAPAVSRDGGQIAVAALKQGQPRLYVMSSDGTNRRALAPSIAVREAGSWSPNGQALAVAGHDEKGSGLFLVPLDGSVPTRLHDRQCYLPVWSPDGSKILFAEYVRGAQMQLKAVSPEGNPVQLPEIRFTRTDVRTMSTGYRFLPDGKSLVVQRGDLRQPQFWLVDLGTGMERQLTDLRLGRLTRSFDVTPDGKRILFDRVQENADIVLIDLAQTRD